MQGCVGERGLALVLGVGVAKVARWGRRRDEKGGREDMMRCCTVRGDADAESD